MVTSSLSSLPLLTPLRGFAALFVVLYHARLVLFPQWKSSIAGYTYFLERGYIWVDLFFILSGYVMIHVYRNTFKDGVTLTDWRQFMWLRFSRIYPLFLITLLTLIAWESFKASEGILFYAGPLMEKWNLAGQAPFEGPYNRGDAILSNLLMLQSMETSGGLSWNISSWSLSIEWLVYLCFPAIALTLLKPFGRSYVVPVIALLMVYALVAQSNSLDHTKSAEALIRGASGFMLGAWMCSNVSHGWMAKCQGGFWVWAMVVGVVFSMHFRSSSLSLMSTYVFMTLLVGISAVQMKPKQRLIRILDNRVTQFLGDISYSVYLWHAVLLLAGTELIHYVAPEKLAWWYEQTTWSAGLIGITVFLAMTIIVSTLSYHGIERPAQRWLRGLFQEKPQKKSNTATNIP
ncbi:acyltransferase [Vibrio sp. S9_S30]|uniref:acyltransferase family protein n=1 Tax=Vibrio sp. S9_S30 TaxID=2720226 RepID=UPI0016807693|nr:acyltransferase [Vibrio sp. S9_S30]MBD1557834.1 acyltransferase [Vibrio sp. S9_S30]